MKKFTLTVFVLIIAAIITYTAATQSGVVFAEKCGECLLSYNVKKTEVYSKECDKGLTFTDAGSFYVYRCKLQDAGMIADKLGNILGVAVFYDGEIALSEVLGQYDAKAVVIDTDQGFTNVYAYSDKLGKGVMLDGEEINIQIAIKDGQTVVGSPLIIGSY